ncbi:hypothetical protein H4219_006437, partial [Mycoemilia scoparia]
PNFNTFPTRRNNGNGRRRRPRYSMAPTNAPEISPVAVYEFFEAIEAHDAAKVRKMVQENRLLTQVRNKEEYYRYDSGVELDAYRCLGAYIGAVTGLQLAVLLGNEEMALDLIDATFQSDLELTFGLQNTTLHLASFLEETEVVRALIERGINTSLKNNKGYVACDLTTNPDILEIFKELVKTQRESSQLNDIPEE